MAIWLVRLVMKLGKMLAALVWPLVVKLAVRTAPVLKPTGLDTDGLTNSVFPEKPEEKRADGKTALVAVAVTGVVEPLGKNTEALLTSSRTRQPGKGSSRWL